jgi:hypothetical protein
MVIIIIIIHLPKYNSEVTERLLNNITHAFIQQDKSTFNHKILKIITSFILVETICSPTSVTHEHIGHNKIMAAVLHKA